MSFKFDWQGDKVKENVKKNCKLALYKCAGNLKQNSVQEVPWETRDLQRNCTIDDQEIEDLTIKVGYDLPYSLIQHESLEFNHPRGGKAKYLSDPLEAKKEDYKNQISEATKKGLEI